MKVEVEGRFHDFCGKCLCMKFVTYETPWEPLGDGRWQIVGPPVTLSCEHYGLCARLWAELQKRIEGSVITDEN